MAARTQGWQGMNVHCLDTSTRPVVNYLIHKRPHAANTRASGIIRPEHGVSACTDEPGCGSPRTHEALQSAKSTGPDLARRSVRRQGLG